MHLGTGSFLLLNTGTEIVRPARPDHHGRRTRSTANPPCMRWRVRWRSPAAWCSGVRDNLGLIRSSPEIETLAAAVPDNGGCYLVPAFSGLFAPYWDNTPAASWSG